LSADGIFTANEAWGLEGENIEQAYKLATTCYFSITTLSTVGYGDLVPVTQLEMVFDIMIMLAGVAFFSFVMGQFISIIGSTQVTNQLQESSFELNNWITLLIRF